MIELKLGGQKASEVRGKEGEGERREEKKEEAGAESPSNPIRMLFFFFFLFHWVLEIKKKFWGRKSGGQTMSTERNQVQMERHGDDKHKH